MTKLPDLAIPQVEIFDIFKVIILGFVVMSFVFVYLGYFLTKISASHSVKSEIYIEHNKYFLACVEFISKMALLGLVQMGAIVIWAMTIYLTGLTHDMSHSFLFAGSCYTTIGIFTDVLPADWKALALIIAFSGLFSFAWSTSVMMSMTTIFQQAWRKKHEENLKGKISGKIKD